LQLTGNLLHISCFLSAGELHKEAEHVVAMATSIVAPSLRQVVLQRLQMSSKQTTAAAMLLVKTCQTAKGTKTSMHINYPDQLSVEACFFSVSAT